MHLKKFLLVAFALTVAAMLFPGVASAECEIITALANRSPLRKKLNGENEKRNAGRKQTLGAHRKLRRKPKSGRLAKLPLQASIPVKLYTALKSSSPNSACPNKRAGGWKRPKSASVSLPKKLTNF